MKGIRFEPSRNRHGFPLFRQDSRFFEHRVLDWDEFKSFLGRSLLTMGVRDIFVGGVLNSRDNWMYPYQRTPMGIPYKYKPDNTWAFMGYNPQESLENTINTMGTLLGVHPIVPWYINVRFSYYFSTCHDPRNTWNSYSWAKTAIDTKWTNISLKSQKANNKASKIHKNSKPFISNNQKSTWSCFFLLFLSASPRW